jgi:hypothetical protein
VNLRVSCSVRRSTAADTQVVVHEGNDPGGHIASVRIGDSELSLLSSTQNDGGADVLAVLLDTLAAEVREQHALFITRSSNGDPS